jgi:hypothetical protein
MIEDTDDSKCIVFVINTHITLLNADSIGHKWWYCLIVESQCSVLILTGGPRTYDQQMLCVMCLRSFV